MVNKTIDKTKTTNKTKVIDQIVITNKPVNRPAKKLVNKPTEKSGIRLIKEKIAKINKIKDKRSDRIKNIHRIRTLGNQIYQLFS